MTRIEQLEQKIKRLEQKICCKTQFFDTVDDLPTEGSTGVIYVTDDGNIYVWNGTEFLLSNQNSINFTHPAANDYQVKSKELGFDFKYTTYLGGATADTPTLLNTTNYLPSFYVHDRHIISSVSFYMVTQGNYTASNYNGIVIYKYDKLLDKLVLLTQTTDDGNIWKATSSTLVTVVLPTPLELEVGLYYIQPYYNYSAQVTAPVIRNANSSIGPIPSAMLIGIGNRKYSLSKTTNLLTPALEIEWIDVSTNTITPIFWLN